MHAIDFCYKLNKQTHSCKIVMLKSMLYWSWHFFVLRHRYVKSSRRKPWWIEQMRNVNHGLLPLHCVILFFPWKRGRTLNYGKRYFNPCLAPLIYYFPLQMLLSCPTDHVQMVTIYFIYILSVFQAVLFYQTKPEEYYECIQLCHCCLFQLHFGLVNQLTFMAWEVDPIAPVSLEFDVKALTFDWCLY